MKRIAFVIAAGMLVLLIVGVNLWTLTIVALLVQVVLLIMMIHHAITSTSVSKS